MLSFAVVSLTLSMIMLFGFPAPQSTIILIPDADGKVGEISVSNNSGTQTISSAYTAIEVKDKQSALSAPRKVDKQQIIKQFDAALSSQPNKVTNYILYFVSGTSTLTEESEKLIPKIVEDLNSRKVYDAFAIGHTDTTGSDEANYKLGYKRASTTAEIINARLPKNSKIRIASYGEGNPIVPTADNVDEPRNRRVEIEIH